MALCALYEQGRHLQKLRLDVRLRGSLGISIMLGVSVGLSTSFGVFGVFCSPWFFQACKFFSQLAKQHSAIISLNGSWNSEG
mmetsp:Transcript_149432/g.258791  ORF Transcript_149432/g.258791 Transcript_149432/m.258791 type:complete len:82 (-) Transcript_149432:1573-1818(-)